MKSVLLIALFQRSINNMLLLSVRFAQQALHPVTIVRTFKQPLACAEHSLSRKIYRQFARQVYKDNCRRFDARALRVQ